IVDLPELTSKVKGAKIFFYAANPKDICDMQKGESSAISKENVNPLRDFKVSTFGCGVCKDFTSAKEKVKHHLYTVHMKILRYKCTICHKMQREKEQNVLHYKNEHQTKHEATITKNYPKLTFNFSDGILYYIPVDPGKIKQLERQHGGNRQVENLEPSTKMTKLEGSLFEKKTGSVYKCILCDFSDTAEVSVYKHIQIDHLGDNIVKCSRCASEFQSMDDLIRHTSSKHGKPQNVQSVDIPFPKKGRLLQEKQGVLLVGNPVWLEQELLDAPKVSLPFLPTLKVKRLTYLEKLLKEGTPAKKICIHMKRSRKRAQSLESLNLPCKRQKKDPVSMTQPIPCPRCSCKIGNKALLESHMKTHFGYKPYKCQICSFSGTTQSDIVVHHNIAHPGRKGKFKVDKDEMIETMISSEISIAFEQLETELESQRSADPPVLGQPKQANVKAEHVDNGSNDATEDENQMEADDDSNDDTVDDNNEVDSEPRPAQIKLEKIDQIGKKRKIGGGFKTQEKYKSKAFISSSSSSDDDSEIKSDRSSTCKKARIDVNESSTKRDFH
ncbi:unnamed protein product, partial [Owenia fusiformis]